MSNSASIPPEGVSNNVDGSHPPAGAKAGVAQPTLDGQGGVGDINELTGYVQQMVSHMTDRFQTMSDQIVHRIDGMAGRIDDLEANIADLMTQAGVNNTNNNTAASGTANANLVEPPSGKENDA